MAAMGWTGDAVEVNIAVSLALGSRRFGSGVAPNPEEYFTTTTVLRVHDTARGATTAGGTISALAEQVAGHADEMLIDGGTEPVYNAADADYEGTPSIESTGTEYMVNVGNILQAQKFTFVWIGTAPTETAARYVVDSGSGAAGAQRCVLQTDNTWDLYAGSTGSTNAAKDGTQPSLVWATFDGASSKVRVRTKAGDLREETVLGSPGTNSVKGAAIMAARTGSLAAAQKFRLLMLLAGEPTVDEIAAFESGYWEGQLGASPLP